VRELTNAFPNFLFGINTRVPTYYIRK